MSLLSAILPVKAAAGAVSAVARALRPNSTADFSAALQEARGTAFVNRWDADKNGTISPDEFPGKTELFAKWDSNGDGTLDEAEAHLALTKLSETARHLAAAQERWNLLDSNGDDLLSQGESGMVRPDFDKMDADGDGLVSRSEWMAAYGVQTSSDA